MTETSTTTKTFRDWSLQNLQYTFQLEQEDPHDEMLKWQEESEEHLPESKSEDAEDLEALRVRLRNHARGWNEEELKMHFIGPLFQLVNFEGKQFNAFAGRPLSAVVGEYELKGIVDGLIARGYLEPVTPYFCLQEYKPEKGRDIDPAGQVLAAMLAARVVNADKEPVYGCYVLGRLWFFVTLSGSEQTFGISDSLDATDRDDIPVIFSQLRWLRDWVAQKTGDKIEAG